MLQLDLMLSLILSDQVLFNNIRSIVAGDQKYTKQFVKDNLIRYNTKTVIDIGCGTGAFIEAVPQDVSYLGVDINKKYISFAKRRFGNHKRRFIVKNVLDKSFYKNKQFDAALFVSMLHHLSDEELSLILPVIKKITRKVVIIADIIPDPEGVLRKLMVRLDQGKFIRPREEKTRLLSKYFKIVEEKIVPSRLAVQLGIICEV